MQQHKQMFVRKINVEKKAPMNSTPPIREGTNAPEKMLPN